MAEVDSREIAESDGDGSADQEPVESLGREESLRAIHAMLFASDRPLNAARLGEALGDVDKDMVEIMLEELRETIAGQDLPYKLGEIAGGYQLIALPEHAPWIRRLLNIKKSPKLSRAILETLAIIAYKQPVTRPDVESIRGVSVSHAFNQLQERGLIKAVGVAEVPGRPRLYRTSDEFLNHFGLNSLKDLPTVEELRDMA